MTQPSAAGPTPEYQAKAAFLFKFTSYVRWPEKGRVPFVIGILGSDPFGSALPDVVQNQVVDNRAIHLRALRRAEDALECDVVFISASEKQSLEKILAVLGRAPVLTVGDMDEFAAQGGMIGLTTTADHHLRFEINNRAVERAGLHASSQLLQLARIVDERGRQ